MKLIAAWVRVLRTPGSTRVLTINLLVVWAVAAIWGWFFVEPTVLQNSHTAREFVDFSTAIFPWLENIRKLGVQAEKGLFLHSVYSFAAAPVGIVVTLLMSCRPSTIETLMASSLMQIFAGALTCFLLSFLVIGLYCYNLKVGAYGLHRTGHAFAVSALTVPPVASFFLYGFWCLLTAGIWSVYCLARKLMTSELKKKA